mmetsp:Transcript_6164/g.13651  ORF Transcript_6164/g.13651 Transcript_6164/m.13651 type:complete len:264 (+) Transcript_6164:64-855(+)
MEATANTANAQGTTTQVLQVSAPHVTGVITAKLLASAVTPQEHDCLCSKDKTHSSHPGNKMFRARIDAMKEIYRKTKNKQGKMEITKEIVRYLKEKHNSRFLKRDGNGVWVEISDQAARDKVSHALRFATRRDSKKAESGRAAISPIVQQQQGLPKFGSVEESAAALWHAGAGSAAAAAAFKAAAANEKSPSTIDTNVQRHGAIGAVASSSAQPPAPAAAAAASPAPAAPTTAAAGSSAPYCGVIPEEHIEPSKWLLALRQGS